MSNSIDLGSSEKMLSIKLDKPHIIEGRGDDGLRQMDWKKLLLSIGISLGTGLLASLLTRGSMDIYSQFKKPVLAPNGWVFPIVWTVLYILMGVSAYLVYASDASTEEKEKALCTYGFQLFLNFLWSIVFFAFKNFLLAFGVILLLWVFIVVMIVRFSKINKTAGWLQLPYLIWVTFAGYLNLAIYWLNR